MANSHQDELVVGVLLYDNVMLLDLVGPSTYLELLSLIGIKVRFLTISYKTGHVQQSHLVPLVATTHYKDAPTKLDILVIPGAADTTQVEANEEFIAYVREAAANATFVLSVCTGATLLAAAGVLDGRRATTNKVDFRRVASTYPNVQWAPRARWVVDEHKWWTSSGVAAGLDMGHAFIAERYGRDVANAMARLIEIVPNTNADEDPFTSCVDDQGFLKDLVAKPNEQ
ncbi:hypothetical protein P43SY_008086 [Pythium insidiosum]|uniref:DJ-1/PfpI domain-containing protein n=1 Tax=Pythium insidiosum TaxID=114742 RepID=A0AAD5Q4E7_PYTIN|nr:hypothetical protein P43SY_008086 [Pythium insidiosum]KAJ0399885.1 hypothetical protein ATCC90586_006500 [Pythium insidiosum]